MFRVTTTDSVDSSCDGGDGPRGAAETALRATTRENETLRQRCAALEARIAALESEASSVVAPFNERRGSRSRQRDDLGDENPPNSGSVMTQLAEIRALLLDVHRGRSRGIVAVEASTQTMTTTRCDPSVSGPETFGGADTAVLSSRGAAPSASSSSTFLRLVTPRPATSSGSAARASVFPVGGPGGTARLGGGGGGSDGSAGDEDTPPASVVPPLRLSSLSAPPAATVPSAFTLPLGSARSNVLRMTLVPPSAGQAGPVLVTPRRSS